MNELQEDVESLTTNIELLKSELEDKNQLIHVYNKGLSLALALEKEYQQEIDILQSNEPSEMKTLKERIGKLEENAVKLKENYHSQLLEKTEMIENLKSQISEFSKICKTNDRRDSYIEGQQAVQKSLELRSRIDSLAKNIEDIESSVNYLQIQNVSLEQNNNILCTELREKNQYLLVKSEELMSAKNNLQSLQEDVFLLKLEFESLKSKPLDECSKGNSLFAEVEDSCHKIQQNLEQTKKNYTRLKQDVTTKMKQLSMMRTQNIELCIKLNMVKGLDENYSKIIKDCTADVYKWEILIEEYKKQASKTPRFYGNDIPNYAIEFANNTFRTKWTSEMKLLEALDNESKKKLETCIEIENINNNMRRWRRVAQQVKVRTEKLENIIAEIELYKNLGAKDDLEECFNKIEFEISEINPSLDVTFDAILSGGNTNVQTKNLTETGDKTIDVLSNDLLGLSAIDNSKLDYSLENLESMKSNLTNVTEIETTFTEKPKVKTEIMHDNDNNLSAIKDDIKNESISIKIEPVLHVSQTFESNISFKIPNAAIIKIDAESPPLYMCKVKSEIDRESNNESVIEIESSLGEDNTTDDDCSSTAIKTENESIVTDSSVEIVGEFKIAQEENVELLDEIKAVAVDDTNSVEVVTELLTNIKIENDFPPLNDIQTKNITCRKQTLCNSSNSLIENGANQITSSEKENLCENVQIRRTSKIYSTPLAKFTAKGIKSDSESKIISGSLPHTVLQKQSSLSSMKPKQYTARNFSTPSENQLCTTSVKSISGLSAVPTRKCTSQSDRKIIKNTTTSIPMPVRKKLL